VISPDGASQSTTTESTSNVTTNAFLLDTITSQSDASGQSVGLVTTSRYLYADTETVVDGTNQISTPRIINTSVTLPADATTPQLAVPQPTQLTAGNPSQSANESQPNQQANTPPPDFQHAQQSIEEEFLPPPEHPSNVPYVPLSLPLSQHHAFSKRCMACHGTGIIDNPMLIQELSDDLQVTIGAWQHEPTVQYKLTAWVVLIAPAQVIEATTGVVMALPTYGTSMYLTLDAVSSAMGSLDFVTDGEVANSFGLKNADFVGQAWNDSGVYVAGEDYGPLVGAGGRILAPIAISSAPSAIQGAANRWTRLQRMADDALLDARGIAPKQELLQLKILNSSYVPNGSRVLQNLTNQVNKKLGNNLPLALTVLSDAEVAAAASSTGIARVQYGNALERLVGRQIKADPILNSLYKHVGGPRNADFVGKGILKGMNFDITTPRQFGQHLARPGYGTGLNLITYERPVGFP
jgi:hypothetical protein